MLHCFIDNLITEGTLYKGISVKRHTAKRHAAKRHTIRITRVSLKHKNHFIYFLDDLVRFSIILLADK